MTAPMGKVEFLSREWLHLFRVYVLEGLADVDLASVDFGMYELYKNVPAQLAPAGSSEIFFGFRIVGGQVDFPSAPWPQAAIKVVADYASLAPWVDLPLEQSRAVGFRERMIRAGALRIEGDIAVRPEIMQKLNLHDRLAKVTAPFVRPPIWE